MKKNKNGNGQGMFVPTPVEYTKADGTKAVWKGRGKRPAEIQAMFDNGTYVPPSAKARLEKKAARDAKRAAKAAEKAAKTAPAAVTADAQAPIAE